VAAIVAASGCRRRRAPVPSRAAMVLLSAPLAVHAGRISGVCTRPRALAQEPGPAVVRAGGRSDRLSKRGGSSLLFFKNENKLSLQLGWC